MEYDFEQAVSRAVFAAHLVERALHSTRPWAMRVGDVVVPVVRDITSDGLIMRASFPEHCWIERPAMLVLVHDGEDVFVREIEPSDAGFQVNWGFDVLVPV